MMYRFAAPALSLVLAAGIAGAQDAPADVSGELIENGGAPVGTLTMAEATRYTSRWTWFCASIKAWGYRQDELPSTHPVAADAPDTDAALLNLDGISYAKGAGVLKQLVAWVGFEAFLAGLHAYFERHAYGSTSLADLLAALEPASGRDLRATLSFKL